MNMKQNKFMKNLIIFLLTLQIYFVSFGIGHVMAGGIDNAFGRNSQLSNMGISAEYETDNTKADVYILFGRIINAILSIIGVFFLALTIYAGYNWMTAQGNETQIERAKKTISSSLIGVILVFTAYALSYFILARVAETALRNTGN